MGNGSAAASSGDSRRVGGVGGKNLRSSAARNSLLNGLDVCRVAGTGKQGGELKVGIAGLVSVENVSETGRPEFPSVSIVVNGGAYSDVTGVICGRRAAKNPKGLVGVVLAGININHQLRLGFAPPPPAKADDGH